MPDDIKAALSAKAEELKGDDAGFSIEGLWNVIEAVLHDGKLTQGDFEPVAQFAEEMFDTYVVPYDIPKVNRIVESIIEQRILRPGIRIGLKVLFENYVSD